MRYCMVQLYANTSPICFFWEKENDDEAIARFNDLCAMCESATCLLFRDNPDMPGDEAIARRDAGVSLGTLFKECPLVTDENIGSIEP